jgi:hypothetical protein
MLAALVSVRDWNDLVHALPPRVAAQVADALAAAGAPDPLPAANETTEETV